MNIKRLDWDSDFLGLRIGRADVFSEKDGMVLADVLPQTNK